MAWLLVLLVLPTAAHQLLDISAMWTVAASYLRHSSSLRVVAPNCSSDVCTQLLELTLSGVDNHLGKTISVATEPQISADTSWQTFLVFSDYWLSVRHHLAASLNTWSPRDRLVVVIVGACSSQPSSYLLHALWADLRALNVLALQACPDVATQVALLHPFMPQWSMPLVLKLPAWDTSKLLATARERVLNLRGRKFAVSMFPRFPTAIPLTTSGEEWQSPEDGAIVSYRGMDGRILHLLASFMNFEPMLKVPSDGHEYGYVQKTNTTVTFTGAIGDVLYGRAEITFNALFVKCYGSNGTEFTRPVYRDKVCIIVPKAGLLHKMHILSLVLHKDLQLVLAGLYLATAALWYLLRWSHKSARGTLLDTLRLFLGTSLPKLPHTFAQRILVLAVMIFSVVLVTLVQARLFIVMSRPMYQHDMQTLDDLDHSGLYIGTGSPNMVDLFGREPESPLMARLLSRIHIVHDGYAIDHAAFNRNMAAMLRESDARFDVLLKYVNPDGSELLHTIPQCPRVYYLSYVVARGSPYLPRINAFITRMVEAGILKKCEEDEILTLVLHTRRLRPEKKHIKVLTLEDLQLSFIVLAVGCITSATTFGMEFMSILVAVRTANIFRKSTCNP